MRSVFAALDDVLIERLFQPMADLVSLRIGISRAGAICFLIDLASLSWIVSRSRGLCDAQIARDVMATLFDITFLLLGLVALTSLRMLFRRIKPSRGNPLRLAMRPHRAVVLLLFAAQLAQFQALGLTRAADLIMLGFAGFALYLGACGERPPARNTWTARLAASTGS